MEDQYNDLCHLDQRPYIDFLNFFIVQRSIKRVYSKITQSVTFFLAEDKF